MPISYIETTTTETTTNPGGCLVLAFLVAALMYFGWDYTRDREAADNHAMRQCVDSGWIAIRPPAYDTLHTQPYYCVRPETIRLDTMPRK